MDKTMIVIMVCLGVYGLYQLADRVILPMFHAYLQYKKEMAELAMYNEPPREFYREVKNEERLQRDNDVPDIKQRSGKSNEGTSIHDEELSL